MVSRLLQFLVLLTAANPGLAAFGPAFSTGPVGSGSFIREATSTLIVPEGNTPLQGTFSLWVGMGTDNGDLVQTILDRHPGVGGSICEDIKDDSHWCAYTYTLSHTGDQIIGPQVSVAAGDHLEYRYVYNYDTQNYDQFAVLNGEVKSTLSTQSGKAGGWGTAVECAATDCGHVPAHQWINTVITLDSADQHYGDTAGNNGAPNSGFITNDGGLTWMVDTINVSEYTFS